MIFILKESEVQEIVYEDLFSRTIGYLRQGGISLTRDTALATLRLMEELLVSDSRNVVGRVVVELPRRLEIPDNSLPLPSPPVNRGSMGYWDEQ